MTTKRTTKAKTTETTATATEPEAQPAQQQPEQPQRIKDAIKAHQNAIDFIHTAIHRTDCAIQLLTRNGYFSTVQHLQQAKVHLRESERSCRSMIRIIREGNQ
jgi:hypothetical protein